MQRVRENALAISYFFFLNPHTPLHNDVETFGLIIEEEEVIYSIRHIIPYLSPHSTQHGGRG